MGNLTQEKGEVKVLIVKLPRPSCYLNFKGELFKPEK